jgi:hypothetical protein
MARPGKAKKKRDANYKNKPLSKFVRGVISAEEYFKLIGQTVKK